MKKIVLIMAMEQEAKPILHRLGFQRCSSDKTAFFQYSEARLADLSLVLSVSGKDSRLGVDRIGLETAALQTFDAIQKFKPDLVINAGTAGSFASKGAVIGDVYLSEKHFVYHDHRIPLSGFSRWGLGEFPSWDTSQLAKYLQLKRGIVSSGSSLDFTEVDLEVFHSLGATLKEMEAAAIAYVCSLFQVPVFAVKSVTNLLDQNPDSPSEFLKNLDKAVISLTHALENVLRALNDHTQV